MEKHGLKQDNYRIRLSISQTQLYCKFFIGFHCNSSNFMFCFHLGYWTRIVLDVPIGTKIVNGQWRPCHRRGVVVSKPAFNGTSLVTISIGIDHDIAGSSLVELDQVRALSLTVQNNDSYTSFDVLDKSGEIIPFRDANMTQNK